MSRLRALSSRRFKVVSNTRDELSAISAGRASKLCSSEVGSVSEPISSSGGGGLCEKVRAGVSLPDPIPAVHPASQRPVVLPGLLERVLAELQLVDEENTVVGKCVRIYTEGD